MAIFWKISIKNDLGSKDIGRFLLTIDMTEFIKLSL